MVVLAEHEKRMVMRALYLARRELKPTWIEDDIKNVLRSLIGDFGYRATRDLEPEIYQYVFGHLKLPKLISVKGLEIEWI